MASVDKRLSSQHLIKAALVALALLTVLLFGVLSFAEDGEAEAPDSPAVSDPPEVVSNNLAYAEYTYILYAVDTKEYRADQIELLFWTEEPEAVTDAPDYVDSVSEIAYNADGDVKYDCVFRSRGVAPKDAPDQLYAATHVKNTDIYGELTRYSLLEYLYERQTTDGINDVQKRLYIAMLELTEAMQIALNHDVENVPSTYRRLRVQNGLIDGKFNTGIFKIGSTVSVSLAESSDEFIYWQFENETVSRERNLEFTIGTEHTSITAVFGDGSMQNFSAPIQSVEDGVVKYFAGWYNSSDELQSLCANAELPLVDAYYPLYLTRSELQSCRFNDFSDGVAPDLYKSATDTYQKYDGEDDVCNIADPPAGVGFDSSYGSVLSYDSFRNDKAPESYMQFGFASATADDVKRVSFDALVYCPLDAENVYSSYFTNAGKSVLYHIGIASGSGVLLDLAVVAVVDSGKVTGFNLAYASDESETNPSEFLLEKNVGITEVMSIGFEFITDEDAPAGVICNLYCNGELAAADLELGSASYNPASMKLYIGTTRYTKSSMMIDNMVCIGLNE